MLRSSPATSRLLAVVMSAKMDLRRSGSPRADDRRLSIPTRNVRRRPRPRQHQSTPQPQPADGDRSADRRIRRPVAHRADVVTPIRHGSRSGARSGPRPIRSTRRPHPAFRSSLGPRSLTPPAELQAALSAGRSSPARKRRSLKLRLTIDQRGRVIAVEPVGRADAPSSTRRAATCLPTGATGRRARTGARCRRRR